ncbi:hypothetical protein [Streptomyces fagopyri]|uniref:hypothetical protein n=1 Tax=Streptomyces fagopyri TaxID=2662397 RepID=UPI0037FBAAF6
MSERTQTPDTVTVNEHGHTSTAFTLKRACNGCGAKLGDLDDRDFTWGGKLRDVRAECPACAPLVELEAAGCATFLLTLRSYGDIDRHLDQEGVFAKGYTRLAEGRLKLIGIRIGERPNHTVARFGDWIIRHPDGHWTVHHTGAER